MKFKKLCAGIMAIAMLWGGVGASTASAISISGVSGSSFEYEILTTKVSSTRVKVEIIATTNPGINYIGFNIGYDTTKCTAEDDSLTCSSARMSTMVNNAGCTVINLVFRQNYSGNFVADFYYDLNSSSTTSMTFTSGVINYSSTVENISYSAGDSASVTDETITVQGVSYLMGDVDDNGSITLNDASAALMIPTYMNNAGYSNHSVENMNIWRLVTGSSYIRGEAVDVDEDGMITTNDAQEIMDYTTAVSAQATLPAGSLVNTHRVVYTNNV